MPIHLLILLGVVASVAHTMPNTNFSAFGRLIVVSSDITACAVTPQLFQMQGFSYSNSRIGEGPPIELPNGGFDAISRPDICEQDFSKMRALGANTVKLYDLNLVTKGISALHWQCLDLAWNNGTHPIFVILSIWIPVLPFSSAEERMHMALLYAQMVNETSDHPSVLGYSIGSEIGGDPNDNPAYWYDFNVIANETKGALRGRMKLVTTGTYQADCTSCNPVVPCLGHVINGEKYGAQVDVWGVDIYSPDPDEPQLRQDVFFATQKPFFFPEFGVTFQPPCNETEVSDTLFHQVAGLMKYSFSLPNQAENQGPTYNASDPVYAGGLIFEWIDEYWKGGSLCSPNSGSAQPFYGVNSVQLRPNCSCGGGFNGNCATDVRLPRPILAPGRLPLLWRERSPRW